MIMGAKKGNSSGLKAGWLIAVAAFAMAGSRSFAQEPVIRMPWWDRAHKVALGSGVMYTDLSEPAARTVIARLRGLYAEYSARLGSLQPRPGAQMNVLAFAKHDDYDFTLRSRFVLHPGPREAVFFDSPFGEVLAVATDPPLHRVQRDTAHEGFHQFAFAAFGGDLPIWVEEGLALHFGDGLIVNDRFVTTGVDRSVLYPVRKAIADDRAIPFSNIMQMTRRQWRTNTPLHAGPLQAAQSRLMVEYLLYADQDRDGKADHAEAFMRFLRLTNSAIPADRAWKDVFGEDVAAA